MKFGQVDLIQTIRFDKVEDLFDHVAPWRNDLYLNEYIFRGHGQESYELVPNALRLEQRDLLWDISPVGKPTSDQWQWDSWQVLAEYNILRDFYRLADRMGLEVPLSPRIRKNLVSEYNLPDLRPERWMDETWIFADLLEVAALAQHYGVPTRLLDWTYDLYVALYFGFTDAIGKDGYLVIWALEKEYLSFKKGTTKPVSVDFITPHYAKNPNLSAQQGLFSHWPIPNPEAKNPLSIGRDSLTDRRPLDKLIDEQLGDDLDRSIFMKFVLPCSEAVSGCEILERLGYGAAKLFPGYSGVAKQILSRRHIRAVPPRADD